MNKLQKLRKLFKIYKLDGYIVPKNDEFFGEYIPDIKDNLKFISNFSGSYGFALILKKKNEGKGSAVKLGLNFCKNDIIVIQDADLEYNPKDLNVMINKIKGTNVDIAFGNRFFHKNNNYHYFFYYIHLKEILKIY